MRDARVRQPYVLRSYLVPAYDPANPREAAALDILSDILGSGITSRLARSIQLDDKIAIDTGAYYSAVGRDPSDFTVYGVPGPGQDLATVEKAIDGVLAELVRTGPTEEEIGRVKRLSRAALIYAQDDLSAQAQLYGSALAVGRTVSEVQGWPQVVQSITAEEVRAVAEKYLVPERSVTGWLESAEGSG
jgi:zinc protease